MQLEISEWSVQCSSDSLSYFINTVLSLLFILVLYKYDHVLLLSINVYTMCCACSLFGNCKSFGLHVYSNEEKVEGSEYFFKT